jgi:hypothetical protein
VNASGAGPSSIYGVAQCKVNNFCALSGAMYIAVSPTG